MLKSTKTLPVLVFCLIFSYATVFAQDSKTKQEVKVEPETKSEPKSEPVEVKVEPSSPPATNNDSPPTYESPESNSSSDTSSTNNTSTSSTSTSPRTTIRNDVERRRRRAMQKEEIERQKRRARRKNRRKNKDKDKYYENCPYNDPYGDCDKIYDIYSDRDKTAVNPLIYFGKNDIAYFNYNRYQDDVTANYSPYFVALEGNYKPLYSVGFVEAQPDLPYIVPYWVYYYEPDLDNFFIDFSRFDPSGTANFERMVLTAVGKKTIKRVGKLFKYKGKVRSVLVEDISSFTLDRIYTFNLSYLPKGNYKLKLLSKTGDTAEIEFKLK